MRKSFEKKLRRVQYHYSINLFLQKAAWILLSAGVLGILAILVERFLAVTVFHQMTLWTSGGIMLLCLLTWWWLSRPSAFQVALAVDDRLKFHERFSTALALDESTSPFALQAQREIQDRIDQVQPQREFPIRPTRCWGYAGLIWIITLLLAAFLPQKDLFGFLAQREKDEQQIVKMQEQNQLVRESTSRVKLAVKQLGDPELDADLKALESLGHNAELNATPRQAIRKLGNLADRVEKMQNKDQAEALAMMQKMLRQLKGASSQEQSQQFRQALAQGKFPQASSLLRQMQRQLEQAELSEQQKKALGQQMQALAKQLKKLADENKMLEKELEKSGLDKKLAKLNMKDLREALKKKGMGAEQIEEMMKKASACQNAANRCSNMAEAMAACGGGEQGLSEDALAELADQLNEIESFQQQQKLTQATLDEIENAIACMGQGQCDGPGKHGPWRAGESQKYGSGTGGPGRGYGSRNSDTEGDTTSQNTRVISPNGQGPVIASWYFKGNQVKGQSQRPLDQVVQSARDNVAEAISENEIPLKYQDSVKDYFGRLDETTGN